MMADLANPDMVWRRKENRTGLSGKVPRDPWRAPAEGTPEDVSVATLGGS